MFDDEVSSTFVVYSLSERRLYLFCDVEVVEDRYCASVFLYYTYFVGCDDSHIVLYLLEDIIVVDVDAVV